MTATNPSDPITDSDTAQSGTRRTRRTPLTIRSIETVPLTEDQEQQAVRALAMLLAHWWQQQGGTPAHGSAARAPDRPVQPPPA